MYAFVVGVSLSPLSFSFIFAEYVCIYIFIFYLNFALNKLIMERCLCIFHLVCCKKCGCLCCCCCCPLLCVYVVFFLSSFDFRQRKTTQVEQLPCNRLTTDQNTNVQSAQPYTHLLSICTSTHMPNVHVNVRTKRQQSDCSSHLCHSIFGRSLGAFISFFDVAAADVVRFTLPSFLGPMYRPAYVSTFVYINRLFYLYRNTYTLISMGISYRCRKGMC